ncbi:Chromosome partition protein Smc [Carpediemonas membranifera]|uniref:Chromosome partition protein Smc n=1 Tax=Carpediemonas membranifera TaxID=201153 RepID=A0A8J6B6X2_9EUKA|nr:Chromosome partition protein Smc [Carpediemonas membranifera]|eukprot:KAG9394067.1 Chromosome partition protein Smc [Carpediemonas membranifera]
MDIKSALEGANTEIGALNKDDILVLLAELERERAVEIQAKEALAKAQTTLNEMEYAQIETLKKTKQDELAQLEQERAQIEARERELLDLVSSIEHDLMDQRENFGLSKTQFKAYSAASNPIMDTIQSALDERTQQTITQAREAGARLRDLEQQRLEQERALEQADSHPDPPDSRGQTPRMMERELQIAEEDLAAMEKELADGIEYRPVSPVDSMKSDDMPSRSPSIMTHSEPNTPPPASTTNPLLDMFRTQAQQTPQLATLLPMVEAMLSQPATGGIQGQVTSGNSAVYGMPGYPGMGAMMPFGQMSGYGGIGGMDPMTMAMVMKAQEDNRALRTRLEQLARTKKESDRDRKRDELEAMVRKMAGRLGLQSRSAGNDSDDSGSDSDSALYRRKRREKPVSPRTAALKQVEEMKLELEKRRLEVQLAKENLERDQVIQAIELEKEKRQKAAALEREVLASRLRKLDAKITGPAGPALEPFTFPNVEYFPEEGFTFFIDFVANLPGKLRAFDTAVGVFRHTGAGGVEQVLAPYVIGKTDGTVEQVGSDLLVRATIGKLIRGVRPRPNLTMVIELAHMKNKTRMGIAWTSFELFNSEGGLNVGAKRLSLLRTPVDVNLTEATMKTSPKLLSDVTVLFRIGHGQFHGTMSSWQISNAMTSLYRGGPSNTTASPAGATTEVGRGTRSRAVSIAGSHPPSPKPGTPQASRSPSPSVVETRQALINATVLSIAPYNGPAIDPSKKGRWSARLHFEVVCLNQSGKVVEGASRGLARPVVTSIPIMKKRVKKHDLGDQCTASFPGVLMPDTPGMALGLRISLKATDGRQEIEHFKALALLAQGSNETQLAVTDVSGNFKHGSITLNVSMVETVVPISSRRSSRSARRSARDHDAMNVESLTIPEHTAESPSVTREGSVASVEAETPKPVSVMSKFKAATGKINTAAAISRSSSRKEFEAAEPSAHSPTAGGPRIPREVLQPDQRMMAPLDRDPQPIPATKAVWTDVKETAPAASPGAVEVCVDRVQWLPANCKLARVTLLILSQNSPTPLARTRAVCDPASPANSPTLLRSCRLILRSPPPVTALLLAIIETLDVATNEARFLGLAARRLYTPSEGIDQGCFVDPVHFIMAPDLEAIRTAPCVPGMMAIWRVRGLPDSAFDGLADGMTAREMPRLTVSEELADLYPVPASPPAYPDGYNNSAFTPSDVSKRAMAVRAMAPTKTCREVAGLEVDEAVWEEEVDALFTEPSQVLMGIPPLSLNASLPHRGDAPVTVYVDSLSFMGKWPKNTIAPKVLVAAGPPFELYYLGWDRAKAVADWTTAHLMTASSTQKSVSFESQPMRFHLGIDSPAFVFQLFAVTMTKGDIAVVTVGWGLADPIDQGGAIVSGVTAVEIFEGDPPEDVTSGAMLDVSKIRETAKGVGVVYTRIVEPASLELGPIDQIFPPYVAESKGKSKSWSSLSTLTEVTDTANPAFEDWLEERFPPSVTNRGV